uniref:ORF131 n=1 Tax=Malaco herpesvirus 1 TaxID=3031797 RepID=A0AA48P7Z0_9VIRU|nr:TPA_asm: ORF131 [Malaco herpesvirus 1]
MATTSSTSLNQTPQPRRHKMATLSVTVKCSALANRRFIENKSCPAAQKYSSCVTSNKEAKDQGTSYHEMISTSEETRVHLTHINENNKKEADLLNLISKLMHLQTYDYVSEMPLSWVIQGVLYRGRIDRINWDSEKKVLEICDLKTHGFNFLKDDGQATVPDVGKKTEYSYRLQLHFYAAMIEGYLTNELDEKLERSLRRRLIGPVFNSDNPIHPIIANTCKLPATSTLEDLFATFKAVRKEFNGAKIKLFIYHLDQASMRRSLALNGGRTDKGEFEVVMKPYRFISDFLTNELRFKHLEADREKSIAAEKAREKRKAPKATGGKKTKRKRRV